MPGKYGNQKPLDGWGRTKVETRRQGSNTRRGECFTMRDCDELYPGFGYNCHWNNAINGGMCGPNDTRTCSCSFTGGGGMMNCDYWCSGGCANSGNSCGPCGGSCSEGPGGPGPGPGCFQAGTKVDMIEGTKNIEDIQVGDVVKTYNKEKDSIETSNVIETFIHENNTDGLLLNGFIKTTTNHPFYANGTWIVAGELVIGDKILHLDGTERIVESIELLNSSETVYNFEVKDTHTYFVEGYLAHNKGEDRLEPGDPVDPVQPDPDDDGVNYELGAGGRIGNRRRGGRARRRGGRARRRMHYGGGVNHHHYGPSAFPPRPHKSPRTTRRSAALRGEMQCNGQPCNPNYEAPEYGGNSPQCPQGWYCQGNNADGWNNAGGQCCRIVPGSTMSGGGTLPYNTNPNPNIDFCRHPANFNHPKCQATPNPNLKGTQPYRRGGKTKRRR